MTADYPPTPQWTPSLQAVPRPQNWPALTLAAIAVGLAAAALIVSLRHPTITASAPTPQTYTSAESIAAHQALCETYKLAARAVQIQTSIEDRALATAGTVNGAVMLQQAVTAAPELALVDRSAALALADAYTNANAFSSYLHRDDPEWKAVVNDVNAKDAKMKARCAGG
ncbi:hypothetical protein NJB1907f44_30080 [Mycobacterium marinum]|nr:hypothetical protein [Mycobacterium marinum]GJN97552.1 hypothetical protein NJB1808e29_13580 [Mycobacterium marinum]GJO08257.1 hypothetical protein NJB1907E90_22820 [Mycobacterium marinum]GJO08854.1 hypothetical protein NJB1907f34b_37740 [Mycobacterium marinum]GJO15430.1 hypothetical protein NJB1907E11_14250 [Mycobacterium marinum]GJO24712.1 hypothetical protein NJB1728e18_30400 [Mycobacterium marinum]